MFGWTLIRESEILLMKQIHELELKNEVAARHRAEEYAAKAENLLDHERVRIDEERLRADRVSDSLLQVHGLPPVSQTVVAEVRAAEKVSADKLEEYSKELMEIYADQEDELLGDGADPLPEILEDKKP